MAEQKDTDSDLKCAEGVIKYLGSATSESDFNVRLARIKKINEQGETDPMPHWWYYDVVFSGVLDDLYAKAEARK